MKSEHYDLLDVELRSYLGLYFWGRALDIAPADDRQFRAFADYVTDIAASLRALRWDIAAVMGAVLDPRTEAAALEAARTTEPLPVTVIRPATDGVHISPDGESAELLPWSEIYKPRERCGAPTRKGTACRWWADECPVSSHGWYRDDD